MGDLYGTTIDASDPFFGLLTDDQKILEQASVLRLSTQRSTYWTDPEYGDELTEMLLEGLTQASLARIAGRIVAELEKDERVGSVEAIATIAVVGAVVGVSVAITVTPSAQLPPFSFTLEITDVSVDVLTEGSA